MEIREKELIRETCYSSWACRVPPSHVDRPTPNTLLLGAAFTSRQGILFYKCSWCISVCASNIKIEPVLSVQTVKLYIRGCLPLARRLM